jgi:hypothetical protein
MQGRPVTFVLVKTVFGIVSVQFQTDRIPRCFRQNGCGRNGSMAGVTFDDGFCRATQTCGNAIAIYQGLLRFDAQTITGSLLASMAACKILMSSISATVALAISQAKALSLIRTAKASRRLAGQLLGVIQAFNGIVRVQNHSSGKHGTG